MRFQRRRPRARTGKAQGSLRLTRSERNALNLLQEKGYHLKDVHPKIDVNLTVDKKSYDYEHRCNFLVGKKGRTYLVKVKKPGSAPVVPSDLRQDLLVESFYFSPDGILVFDGEKKRLYEISLSVKGPAGIQKTKTRLALAALVVIGCIILAQIVIRGVFS